MVKLVDEQADPHDRDLLPAAVRRADDQRDLPPVLKAGELNDRRAQPAGDPGRRSPASAARSWSAATRSPRACRPTTSTSSSASTPRRCSYAHVTGWFSYYSQTGIERTQNDVLSGDDSRLFVTRLVDLVSNPPPKGGSVELTIDPAAQQAAYDGLSALGPDVQGAVVALEPRTGKILAMVSLPTYDPNKLATPRPRRGRGVRPRSSTTTPPSRMLNRAIQTTLPPGSTFKLVTAAAALESGNYTGDSDGARRPDVQAAAVQPSDDRQRGPRLRHRAGSRSSRRSSSPATPRSPSWPASSADKAMTEQAEKFGFNQHTFDDLPAQAERVYPERRRRGRSTALSRHRPVRRAARRRCRWRWWPAGIANDGTVMKPYLVDEVQLARPRHPRQDRARRRCPRR